MERAIDRADRRCRKLRLTAEGAALVLAMEPSGKRVHDRLLAPLSPEGRQVSLRLLHNMLGGSLKKYPF